MKVTSAQGAVVSWHGGIACSSSNGIASSKVRFQVTNLGAYAKSSMKLRIKAASELSQCLWRNLVLTQIKCRSESCKTPIRRYSGLSSRCLRQLLADSSHARELRSELGVKCARASNPVPVLSTGNKHVFDLIFNIPMNKLSIFSISIQNIGERNIISLHLATKRDSKSCKCVQKLRAGSMTHCMLKSCT